MESTNYTQKGIIPPNPSTKRGHRLSWDITKDKKYIFYPV